MTDSLSIYDDQERVATIVSAGRHRELVGGLWEEVGQLQFDFLYSHGLKPKDHLLDVGCGCLRGGVWFAAYLETGHYWGVDSNASLLEVGYSKELLDAGLIERVPRSNLLHDTQFCFSKFKRSFDMAIAQSVFTHLPANQIRLCLYRLGASIKVNGLFFATYFEAPNFHPLDMPYRNECGVTTFSYRDPYHYQLCEMERFLIDLPWRIVWTGEWGHPRNQKMMILERLPN